MEQDIRVTITAKDEKQFVKLRNAFDIFGFRTKEDFLGLGNLNKEESLEQFWKVVADTSAIDPKDYPEISDHVTTAMFDVTTYGVTVDLEWLSGGYSGEDLAHSIAKLMKALDVYDVEFDFGDYV